jgi:hypothetical protein
MINVLNYNHNNKQLPAKTRAIQGQAGGEQVSRPVCTFMPLGIGRKNRVPFRMLPIVNNVFCNFMMMVRLVRAGNWKYVGVNRSREQLSVGTKRKGGYPLMKTCNIRDNERSLFTPKMTNPPSVRNLSSSNGWIRTKLEPLVKNKNFFRTLRTSANQQRQLIFAPNKLRNSLAALSVVATPLVAFFFLSSVTKGQEEEPPKKRETTMGNEFGINVDLHGTVQQCNSSPFI